MPKADRSTQTNYARVQKLDEEILDLEYMYQRELAREREVGKTMFLMSRGFKYRLDKLREARKLLRQAISNAPTIRANYIKILSERNAAVQDARDELGSLEVQLKDLMVSALMQATDEKVADIAILQSAIKSQKMFILHKENAVNNWIKRESLTQARKSKIRTDIALDAYVQTCPEEGLEIAPEDKVYTREQWDINNNPITRSKAWNAPKETGIPFELINGGPNDMPDGSMNIDLYPDTMPAGEENANEFRAIADARKEILPPSEQRTIMILDDE